MRWLALLAWALVATSPGPAWAQAPFPPPAVLTAPTVDAAAGILGVGRPEYSTHLLVDVAEISLPGTLTATARSELPGTVYLVLLRTKATPQNPPATKASVKPGIQSSRTKATGPAAASKPSPAPTVFIAARKIEPGETPELKASFDFSGPDALTLLAYAQGRWFITGREIKLARPPLAQP